MSDLPRCVGCGDRLSSHHVSVGRPVCSLICAVEVLVELVPQLRRLGWSLDELLPNNPSLVSWDAWQAATKIKGKAAWRKSR